MPRYAITDKAGASSRLSAVGKHAVKIVGATTSAAALVHVGELIEFSQS